MDSALESLLTSRIESGGDGGDGGEGSIEERARNGSEDGREDQGRRGVRKGKVFPLQMTMPIHRFRIL